MIAKKNEKGQIIVILALSMVAMIGFAALALDGSLIYNARRQDQNTADSAALAGAGAIANYLKEVESGVLICGKPAGTQATILAVNAVRASVAVDGISTAEMPKLANDAELAAADQGFTITCDWYGGLGTQYLDVHVKVSTEMETNLAQIVNTDTLKTSVESTARVYPGQPFAYGNGLVSLSDACSTKQGGIEFLGASVTKINEGGVFSNSCLKMNTGEVTVTGGEIQYWNQSECKDCFGNPDVSPEPIPAYIKLPKNMIEAPNCDQPMTVYSAHNGVYSGTISPGKYMTGIKMDKNDDTKSLTLSPGLYCVYDGLTNNAQSNLTADGVTLYFYSGDVAINQNAKGGVSLTSCKTAPCGNPSAVEGLLMFFSPSYQADITLNGGSTNVFKGTLYGSNANFHLNGNTDTTSAESATFSTQIVGNWIEVNGKANLTMDLKGEDFVQLPPSLSLVK